MILYCAVVVSHADDDAASVFEIFADVAAVAAVVAVAFLNLPRICAFALYENLNQVSQLALQTLVSFPIWQVVRHCNHNLFVVAGDSSEGKDATVDFAGCYLTADIEGETRKGNSNDLFVNAHLIDLHRRKQYCICRTKKADYAN